MWQVYGTWMTFSVLTSFRSFLPMDVTSLWSRTLQGLYVWSNISLASKTSTHTFAIGLLFCQIWHQRNMCGTNWNVVYADLKTNRWRWSSHARHWSRYEMIPYKPPWSTILCRQWVALVTLVPLHMVIMPDTNLWTDNWPNTTFSHQRWCYHAWALSWWIHVLWTSLYCSVAKPFFSCIYLLFPMIDSNALYFAIT